MGDNALRALHTGLSAGAPPSGEVSQAPGTGACLGENQHPPQDACVFPRDSPSAFAERGRWL